MIETIGSVLYPSIRRINIEKSPNKNGSSDKDSIPYLEELQIKLTDKKQPIQFTSNSNEIVHRWAPYVQGFSASFVQSIFDKYQKIYKKPKILDPFAGCGTVLVQAKLNKFSSVGTELNPLLKYISEVKLNNWALPPNYLMNFYRRLKWDKSNASPTFLKTSSHFNDDVLHNLELIQGTIKSIKVRTLQQKMATELLKLALSSILIDCSNLTRSPCLGYKKNKIVTGDTPFLLLNKKVHQIAEDLTKIQTLSEQIINTKSKIILANAKSFKHKTKFDLIITSPPYMNGMDYVMNYKIEMGWLDFVQNQRDLKKIKDEMVVCDNVSKNLIKEFKNTKSTYKDQWIDQIKTKIGLNIKKRGSYRRDDMSHIVHKYFDDMYQVMKTSSASLKKGGRFILVVGDSLIADVYVPTDLLLAKIGRDLGLEIESIEKARNRRSGQVRSYRLRETIITLLKK